MQVLDLQNGSAHGLSIAPTANGSADITGAGVDLGLGSMVGHVALMTANCTSDITVNVQESPDDVNANYVTTVAFVVDESEGDEGTEGIADRLHFLQFTRSNRWARVQVLHGSNSNIRVAAGLTSMFSGNGGGSSTSPTS